MISETETLYKLMILYMLKKVNFPLTNTQISQVFLEKEYTDFFVFQKVLNELIDANLVSSETIGRTTRYSLTPEGDQTWNFFGNKIPKPICEDIDAYLKENKFRMRSEIAVLAESVKNEEGEWYAHLIINEGKTNIFDLRLNVPSEKEADVVCNRWTAENQGIYEMIVRKLIK